MATLPGWAQLYFVRIFLIPNVELLLNTSGRYARDGDVPMALTRLGISFLLLSTCAGFAWGLLGHLAMPRVVYENSAYPVQRNLSHRTQQPILWIHMEYEPAVLVTPAVANRDKAIQTKRLELNLISAGSDTIL